MGIAPGPKLGIGPEDRKPAMKPALSPALPEEPAAMPVVALPPKGRPGVADDVVVAMPPGGWDRSRPRPKSGAAIGRSKRSK